MKYLGVTAPHQCVVNLKVVHPISVGEPEYSYACWVNIQQLDTQKV